jgi:hypothetical protein
VQLMCKPGLARTAPTGNRHYDWLFRGVTYFRGSGGSGVLSHSRAPGVHEFRSSVPSFRQKHRRKRGRQEQQSRIEECCAMIADG